MDDAGVLTLAKQSGAQAYLGTAQDIPTTTWTLVNLDTVVYDIQSEFNTTTHRFTAKKAGLYLVVGSCGYDKAQVVADTLVGQAIYKNGVEANSNYLHTAIASHVLFQVTTVISLAVNDYLELKVYHNFGITRTLRTGIVATSLTVMKIA